MRHAELPRERARDPAAIARVRRVRRARCGGRRSGRRAVPWPLGIVLQRTAHRRSSRASPTLSAHARHERECGGEATGAAVPERAHQPAVALAARASSPGAKIERAGAHARRSHAGREEGPSHRSARGVGGYAAADHFFAAGETGDARDTPATVLRKKNSRDARDTPATVPCPPRLLLRRLLGRLGRAQGIGETDTGVVLFCWIRDMSTEGRTAPTIVADPQRLPAVPGRETAGVLSGRRAFSAIPREKLPEAMFAERIPVHDFQNPPMVRMILFPGPLDFFFAIAKGGGAGRWAGRSGG